MEENIKIWLVGNTGLRNPNRIQEGLAVYAKSAFVGKLHGRDNEIGFMNLLKALSRMKAVKMNQAVMLVNGA